MKCISSCFSLVLTMIFFIQSSAWATGTGPSSPYTQMMIERMVENYNSLSQTEKLNEFKKAMKRRPEKDQVFMKKVSGYDPKFVFPEVKYAQGKMTFVFEKKTYEMTPKMGSILVFQGQEVDFGPGKLEAAAEKMEEILNQKVFGFMDIFISPAYALVWLGAFVLGFGALIIGLMAYGKMTVRKRYEKRMSRETCEKFRKGVEVLIGSPTREKVDRLNHEIRSKLYDLEADPKCGKSKRLLPANKKKCESMNYVVGCLEGLRDEVSSYSQSVNGADRGEIEEVKGTSRPSDASQVKSKSE